MKMKHRRYSASVTIHPDPYPDIFDLDRELHEAIAEVLAQTMREFTPRIIESLVFATPLSDAFFPRKEPTC